MSRAAIADAELVARSRRRDPAAFGALVERHQRLVFGVALARCGDPALAEDVAQEAFVAAWRDLDRLREVDRVGPWVAGIARNLASSAVRRQARRAAQPAPPDAPSREVPTPEDEVRGREDRELLRRALADVPAAHREVLVLYYLEGESVARIAAALGIREDLVKQRLSRGRRALRETMAAMVESTLGRVRISAGFRAGVVAAATAAGARKAGAHGAAGKVTAVMATKKTTILVAAALALGGGAVWLATRTGPRAPAALAAAAPAPGPSGERTHAPVTPAPKPDRPHVRRIDPAARATLLAAIRARAEQRRAAPPPSSSGHPTPRPSLPAAADDPDSAYIKDRVRELIPLLTECYSEGLSRNPELAGSVVVDFTIEGDPEVGGVVGDSKIDPKASTLQDPEVDECIQETMYALEIDPPSSGGVVHVRYPFAFASHAAGDHAR